ncbi:hypothetical protein ADU90_06135 (plasmid) [Clostridium botulinum]|uniref:Uncharacterized protein n=1 Tax=Clostridium botulinum C/D str. DC5 TaxID=1443128 RepID=A0A0A0HZT0_CLOBO|nr:hypothetical protein [Clostridium botulinum]KGM93586.1 hypothetical protein Z955_14665 [Clostridium botulinum C/D str. DC5]KOC56913.1 hypothetical protein ADU89_01595 [Clostridium botulinum]KOC57388.1 hypothetical protein ADU90_06135 [Clostridium botulinum]MCD3232624.1 hypothetical protein [Clostridium botulinum D/C]MCD3238447.1 hypothetical protein [Clostridium botulinum D/C]
MTIQKLKKELIAMFEENEVVDINMIQLRGFNKDTKEIKKCIISLEDISSGNNIIFEIKSILHNFEDKFGVCFMSQYLEI